HTHTESHTLPLHADHPISVTQYPTETPAPTAANTPSPSPTIIPAPTVMQTQTQVGQKIYTVAPGDDLWHIAEKFYKSGYNYVDIDWKSIRLNFSHRTISYV